MLPYESEDEINNIWQLCNINTNVSRRYVQIISEVGKWKNVLFLRISIMIWIKVNLIGVIGKVFELL